MDERRNDSETMRRENRRIQAMSWGPTDEIPPPKPCRPMGGNDNSFFTSNSDELLNQEVGTLKITDGEGATADIPQTYIIAQNPEVLARLLAENDNRGINPSSYITPASVFNTLAVDVDAEKNAGKEIPLKTVKLPASEILKLDPVANENDQIDSANSSRANTFDRYTQNFDPCSSSSSTIAASASQSTLGSDTGYQTLSKTPPNLASYLESRKNSLPRQLSSESGTNMNLTGSLDRRPIVPPRTNLPGSQMGCQISTPRSKGGSLERNQSMSGAYDMMRSRVYRGGSLERNPSNGVTVARSGSLERNPNYLAYRTQMKANIENEPVQEEIYDFGGAHLKSCASIALNKGIAKGMIPHGTQLPTETPQPQLQPPQHSNNPFLQSQPQQPPTVMYNIMSMSQPNSLGMPMSVVCGSPMSNLSGSYPQAVPQRPFIKSPQPELHTTPTLVQFQIASGVPMAQKAPVEQSQVGRFDILFRTFL